MNLRLNQNVTNWDLTTAPTFRLLSGTTWNNQPPPTG
jgi:hypothetical protein